MDPQFRFFVVMHAFTVMTILATELIAH